VPASVESIGAFLSGADAFWQAGNEFQYLIAEADSAAVLGGCGLHARLGDGGGALEIGYRVHVDNVRRGLASAAAGALTQAAFGSVLVHVFPDADVPVVQPSINATKPLDHHLDLGRRLAPLRDEGILILGSVNVVHNLGQVDWSQPDGSYDWARRFDERVSEIMTSAPGDILSVVEHADYPLAVPAPDHFIPLLYIAGLADAAQQGTRILVDGYAMGSLSMTCFALGCNEIAASGGGEAPPLPHVPADESNL
jgi:hypothetical protein